MNSGIALVGGLLALLLIGFPVYASFLLICVVGVFALMGPAATGLFTNSILETLTIESFVAIPLYMVLGEVLFRTGGVDRLYKAIGRLIGIVPGRLYVVTIALSTLLGGILGSAMATVAMLGRFVYPTMISRGCDRKLSIGIILGGASLDPIIPPSVLAVVLATLANLSIGEFLVAGILPGILMALAFAAYAILRCVINPALDADVAADAAEPSDQQSLLTAIAQVVPFLVIIGLVIGLVIIGIAQPSEAAAIGIAGALLLSVANRSFSLQTIMEACLSAVRTSSAVLVIVSTAKLFSQLLAFTGSTTVLLEIVSNLNVNRWVIFATIMLVIWVVCMFIDEVGVMLIAVPILTPVVAHFSFDPIWFWMMLLINFTLGGITPPIGYTNFVFKSVAPPGTTMGEIMSAAWPMVLISGLCIVAMCLFPAIVTWLPANMRAVP